MLISSFMNRNFEIIFPKLVLVPLLAFNESGFRLGYGGGFYDKYFSSQEEKDIIKVGLGFSFQNIYEIPIEGHDQKLDWILKNKTSHRGTS